MGKIEITKKDILWGYAGQFFMIGSGLFTLPVILRMLTSEEIGMNYLMLTVSTMVSLLDFGFASQFGLNFTLVHSGAQRLLKEGVEHRKDVTVNYHLLSVLIKTAKMVYHRLSILCAAIMLTAGTAYIYNVTEGFTNVNHSLGIWILFTVSTYFNIYFTYYSSLLRGVGYIAQISKAEILSKSTYIIICISLLYCNIGLLAVVIANFISPFVQRWYCYRSYYTDEIKEKLSQNIDKSEIRETFNTIWYNAKRRGVNMLGSYMVNKSSMFIIGFFLPLSVIGSYGLLLQLTSILGGISQALFNIYYPKFTNLRVEGKTDELLRLMASTIQLSLIVMITGSLVIIYCAPPILELVGSRTHLPSLLVCSIYCISITLEGNHSLFSMLISSNNEVPYVKSSLLSGGAIILFTVAVLYFTKFELLGVVLVPFVVQAAYNNWRWPKWILDEFHVSYTKFVYLGTVEIVKGGNRIVSYVENKIWK